MFPADILKLAYLEAASPMLDFQHLALELRHWYQAFPQVNYLQPCVIEGSVALVCQRGLFEAAPKAAAALRSICRQHGILLKEDARSVENLRDAYLQNRRSMAVVLTFCLSVAAATVKAGNVDSVGKAAAGGFPIAMKIHNQSLADVASNISRQTGAVFKFNAAVEADKIDINLNAADWVGAIGQLLQNYNYTLVQAGDTVKTVFVSGYKGGYSPETVDPSGERVTVTDQVLTESVEVDVPVDALLSMPADSSVDVALPVGVFVVEQASMVALEDGTLSWVGNMDCEETFCRLYLTANPTGELLGNVFTAHGEYNIETVDGRMVMSATTYPGFAAANY